MNETIEQPRKRRIGEAVAEVVATQIEEQAEESIYANADADPQFDKRRGQSNFGVRLANKIQRVIRENE